MSCWRSLSRHLLRTELNCPTRCQYNVSHTWSPWWAADGAYSPGISCELNWTAQTGVSITSATPDRLDELLTELILQASLANWTELPNRCQHNVSHTWSPWWAADGAYSPGISCGFGGWRGRRRRCAARTPRTARNGARTPPGAPAAPRASPSSCSPAARSGTWLARWDTPPSRGLAVRLACTPDNNKFSFALRPQRQ